MDIGTILDLLIRLALGEALILFILFLPLLWFWTLCQMFQIKPRKKPAVGDIRRN